MKSYQLNHEAEEIVQNGSHEAVVFNVIPEGGLAQAELNVRNNSYKYIFLNLNLNFNACLF